MKLLKSLIASIRIHWRSYSKKRQRMDEGNVQIGLGSHHHDHLMFTFNHFGKMKDSYMETLLPFSSDSELRECYINVYGSLRIGKIMEDMDALAGKIAYKHCGILLSKTDNTRDKFKLYNYLEDWSEEKKSLPLTIVTASVDRIDIYKTLRADQDFRLSGFVSCVGRSSMDVLLRLERLKDSLIAHQENWDLMALACFTMVARNASTHTAEPVPQLRIETEEEKELFRAVSARRNARRQARDYSLYKVPPLPEESRLIHDLFLKSLLMEESDNVLSKKDEFMWLSETKMDSVRICHPQERNIHNFIFGGYLMREAFELAFINACVYFRGRAVFLSVDNTNFKQPVPIGSILILTAQTIYSTSSTITESQRPVVCVITVEAELLNVKTGSRLPSNTFNFFFTNSSHDRSLMILPKTYTEAILYLEGKRRLESMSTFGKIENLHLWDTWISKVLQ